MSYLLILLPLVLLEPGGHQEGITGQFILDLDQPENPLLELPLDNLITTLEELRTSYNASPLPPLARAISYAGEDKGLLCFLLGLKPLEGGQWLEARHLNFRMVGLGTRVGQKKAVSRALLAPLAGSQWLLLLAGGFDLDRQRLTKNLTSPKVRNEIRKRLFLLFRDGA